MSGILSAFKMKSSLLLVYSRNDISTTTLNVMYVINSVKYAPCRHLYEYGENFIIATFIFQPLETQQLHWIDENILGTKLQEK